MARRNRRITFQFNKRVLRDLAHGKEMGALMGAGADAVRDVAKELAPVRTGAYQAGIQSRVVKDPKAGFSGQVEATHFTSHFIEFGTVNQPARAPLRRALEAVFGNQIGES